MCKRIVREVVTKDKSVLEGILFPNQGCRICAFKEKREPLQAAVYIKIPIAYCRQGILSHEQAKSRMYCDLQGYQLFAMMESIGCNCMEEKEVWDKVVELAEKGMIDVVVVPSLSRISLNQESLTAVLDELHAYGVGIDCIGEGIQDDIAVQEYMQRSRYIQEWFEANLDEHLRRCYAGRLI